MDARVEKFKQQTSPDSRGDPVPAATSVQQKSLDSLGILFEEIRSETSVTAESDH